MTIDHESTASAAGDRSGLDPAQVIQLIRLIQEQAGAGTVCVTNFQRAAILLAELHTEKMRALDCCEALQAQAESLLQALSQADRLAGHDDQFTEWRQQWAHLWPQAEAGASPPVAAEPASPAPEPTAEPPKYAPSWRHCPTQGAGPAEAWGCPECVREMRGEIVQLVAARDAQK